MKKLFAKTTLLIVAIALCLSMSACNLFTIYVPDNGNDITPSDALGEYKTTATYQQKYAVSAVDLKINGSTGTEKDKITATESVYESVVTIHAGVSAGTQIGSGVIVDIDVTYAADSIKNTDTSNFLYIITCHHVIEGSNEIVVYIPKLVDEQTKEYEYYEYAFGATLMGGDKDTDIAVLRIDATGYEDFSIAECVTKAQICDADLLRGQEIFAIGDPLGELPGSVSYGSVSNVYVPVSVTEIGEMVLMQTDTATNSGNSGGGIFNMAGQLVGILNAGANGYDGISFFIPITGDTGVEKITSALIGTVTSENYGYIAGRWKLGASFTEYGAYIKITALESDSVLRLKGISVNDYVLNISYTKDGEHYACDMRSLSSFSTFYNQMKSELDIGDPISVSFTSDPRRSSNTKTVTVTLQQYIYSV